MPLHTLHVILCPGCNVKCETLRLIKGFCYVSKTKTFTNDDNGAGFRDPRTWDDGVEYFLICVLKSLILPNLLVMHII